jgi:hypothetical protein
MTMLRFVSAAVLVSAATVAHAQSARQIERECRSATEIAEIVAIYMACEPNGRAQYDAMPWQNKITALMACLKSPKAPGTFTERQRVAIEFCFGELE